MMSLSNKLNQYRFHSQWQVCSAYEPLFDALVDLPGYPVWWKEVTEVRRIDNSSARVSIKAALPYSLIFVMTQEVADREKGLLTAMLTGDLDGWCTWTVKAENGICRLAFDQEVAVKRPLLRALSPVGRPLFSANHTLMMRHARKGLQAHLDGLKANN